MKMHLRITDAVATAIVLSLTTFIFLPAVVRAGQSSLQARYNGTLSNAKQLGIGMMMYWQDYDGHYAPAVVAPEPLKGSPQLAKLNSCGWAAALYPYIKNPLIFRSPGLSDGLQPVQFMYNDLISGADHHSITSPAQTVVLMDGEDVLLNTGHAWVKEAIPVSAFPQVKPTRVQVRNQWVVKTLYTVAPGQGATVKTAPVRFNGGGVYCFADGHAQWLSPERVFFPPRRSSSPQHEKGEPTPRENKIASFRLN
jgi:prepilin-type processing-associated H-X9-DG protein